MYRDPINGQYAYDNNFDRMCTCGHPLAVHLAGGFDCINGDKACDERATGLQCDCRKFRPSKKKLSTHTSMGGR